MEEVSNRTLAGLLVVAMVISLTGTFFSLSKLDMLQQDGTITGFALNPNATATLNIDDLTSIEFLVNSVNWGTGTVNSSNNLFCNLTTSNMSSATNLSTSCVGFVSTPPGFLVLNNDGNRHVSVTLAANETPSTWLGDSSGRLYYEVYNNQTSACTGTRLLTADNSLTTTPTSICTNLTFTNGQDTLNIPLKVRVPYNISTGQKTVRLTAVATAV